MKLRQIVLVLALVTLMVLGLASCVKGGGPATNPPTGTTVPGPSGDSYTITFTGVDGYPNQYVAAGQKPTEPAKPTKDYHKFDGWYLESGEKFNWGKAIEGNVKLVAQFSPLSYEISYDFGAVDVEENPNPGEYTYSEEKDLYLAPLSDPSEEYFFLGWSVVCIDAGTNGAIEVKANWIEMDKLIKNYGFEFNDGNATRIHYSEMQGQADDDSTWYEGPDGVKQYYVSSAGAHGGAGYFIQQVWAPNLNHESGVNLFDGWKGLCSMPSIGYGEGANGYKNPYLTTRVGNEVNTGFQTHTLDQDSGEAEKYTVTGFFSVGEPSSENVIINVDFRMRGDGAFPLNFYLQGTQGTNYSNGDDRVNMFYIDGNGDIVVGDDVINAARVAYVDGSGNAMGRKVIGNVGDEKWHTLTIDMKQASGGYAVVIKVDGVQVGDTLTLKSNVNFTGENAVKRLMIFGGTMKAVEAVDAMVAAGRDVEVNYDLDNFVIYAR